MRQLDKHIFKGMKRGLHPIRQNNEYLWEAHNIRINIDKENSSLSIVNEKSTKRLFTFEEDEYYVGHTIIGKYLILFTERDDCGVISRINLEDKELKRYILISENELGISKEHPIQCVTSYENEFIQKVYWTDNNSQPRFINVAKPELLYGNNAVSIWEKSGMEIPDFSKGFKADKDYKPVYFSNLTKFVPDLNLDEKVNVHEVGGSGLFPSGVIQYLCTYVSKYGQESNIFYISPLLYLHKDNRGASPEESVHTAFKINISNINQEGFTYIRIYSVIRSSWNGVPSVKRVVDLNIGSSKELSYIDTNTSGNNVDPMMLLYLGGKEIVAGCIESKDNTLFLGNINIVRKSIKNINVHIESSENGSIDTSLENIIKYGWYDDDYLSKFLVPHYRSISMGISGSSGYNYSTQLTNSNISTFKSGETYRLGLQFQHKSGEWSEPMFVKDVKYDKTGFPCNNQNTAYLPTFSFVWMNNEYGEPVECDANIKFTEYDAKEYTLQCRAIVKALLDNGYVKVRPIVVLPEITDRTILCQGILNPTSKDHEVTDTYYSSCVFRPMVTNIVSPFNSDPAYVRSYTKVPFKQGAIGYRGYVNETVTTFHSPDIEFNEGIKNYLSFSSNNLSINLVGFVKIDCTLASVNLLMDSPNYNAQINGFVHPTDKVLPGSGSYYEGKWFSDNKVIFKEDGTPEMFKLKSAEKPVLWPIYLWQPAGSINNDINRADGSMRTTVPKIKMTSNLKYSGNNIIFKKPYTKHEIYSNNSVLFNSNELEMKKIGTNTYYMGNMDYMKSLERHVLFKSDNTPDISYLDNIRIKYKSTPHMVIVGKKRTPQIKAYYDAVDPDIEFKLEDYVQPYDLKQFDVDYDYDNTEDKRPDDSRPDDFDYEAPDEEFDDDPWRDDSYWAEEDRDDYRAPQKQAVYKTDNVDVLWLAELIQKVDDSKRFGGNSDNAISENTWIPAGEAVDIRNFYNKRAPFVEIIWKWGDTWFQRYDCLKTYPFTNEDLNQMVEICSFMCESRMNIDGRYDKNRGLKSNFYVSPINFNRINNVYSQLDNLYNSKILDEDYYKTTKNSNMVTWTNTKVPCSDVDEYTKINLSSTLNLDGLLGEITDIKAFNKSLYGFQEKGISVIGFNSRVQIQTSDGVPIEITNNNRVDGYKVISYSIGCQNKFSIATSPYALYLTDSITDSIYKIGQSVSNISSNSGIRDWSIENIFSKEWKPWNTGNTINGIRTCYDSRNGDIYFIPGYTNIESPSTLCYSEAIGEFMSTFDYNGSVMFPYKNNLYAFAVSNVDNRLCLWNVCPSETKSHNILFDKYVGFNIGFISNEHSEMSKVFDTVDIEADIYEGGAVSGNKSNNPPVKYIEAINEYQYGKYEMPPEDSSNQYFRKKFRIWRALIPRQLNLRQRIVNPWVLLRLGKTAEQTESNKDNKKVIIHNVSVGYTI